MKLSEAALLGVGPYDLENIGPRLNEKRVQLKIHTENDLCPLIKMTRSRWTEKCSGVRPFNLREINTVLWAFERLRPGWRCPPGFPYIPEDWALRIDEQLPGREHPSGDRK